MGFAQNQNPNANQAPVIPYGQTLDIRTELTSQCTPIKTAEKIEKQDIRLVPPGLGKRINKALEMAAEEKFQESLDRLKGGYNTYKRDKYFKALLDYYIGYGYYYLEQMSQALIHLEAAADSNQLLLKDAQGARFLAAYLQFSNMKNYKKTVSHLVKWFSKEVNPDITAYAMLSYSYHHLKQTQKSACVAYWGVRASKKAEENLLRVLLTAHQEVKDWKGAAKIATVLVEEFPAKDEYWSILSGIYLELKDRPSASRVLSLLEKQERFKNKAEYKVLVGLYVFLGLYEDAARITEEGMKKKLLEPSIENWKIAAQNWRLARETDKAIHAYGELAKLTSNGNAEMQQMIMSVSAEKWRDVIKYADNANKKKLKEQDKKNSLFYKAQSFYHLNKLDKAIVEFEKLIQLDYQKTYATSMIDFIRTRQEYDPLLSSK